MAILTRVQSQPGLTLHPPPLPIMADTTARVQSQPGLTPLSRPTTVWPSLTCPSPYSTGRPPQVCTHAPQAPTRHACTPGTSSGMHAPQAPPHLPPSILSHCGAGKATPPHDGRDASAGVPICTSHVPHMCTSYMYLTLASHMYLTCVPHMCTSHVHHKRTSQVPHVCVHHICTS